MSNKDLAEMIDNAFGILIVLGGILWLWLYLKLDKIYDELKKIRKEVKYSECVLESVECGECTHYPEAILVQEETEGNRMKINKIIKSTVEREIEITGVTLLSIGETEKYLSREDRQYEKWWWLRSPGNYSYRAANVSWYGDIDSRGNNVVIAFCVRPALQISNLKSSNLEIGDIFELGGFEFKVISENLAWMHKQDIGNYAFNNDTKNRNDYETSDIKKSVDKWFESLVFNELEESSDD